MLQPDSLNDREPLPLSDLAKGECGVVQALRDVESGAVGEVEGSTVVRRLLELGFVPGEALQVVATAWPSGDPMAVRVGAGVFALRRREARSVIVRRSPR